MNEPIPISARTLTPFAIANRLSLSAVGRKDVAFRAYFSLRKRIAISKPNSPGSKFESCSPRKVTGIVQIHDCIHMVGRVPLGSRKLLTPLVRKVSNE